MVGGIFFGLGCVLGCLLAVCTHCYWLNFRFLQFFDVFYAVQSISFLFVPVVFVAVWGVCLVGMFGLGALGFNFL